LKSTVVLPVVVGCLGRGGFSTECQRHATDEAHRVGCGGHKNGTDVSPDRRAGAGDGDGEKSEGSSRNQTIDEAVEGELHEFGPRREAGEDVPGHVVRADLIGGFECKDGRAGEQHGDCSPETSDLLGRGSDGRNRRKRTIVGRGVFVMLICHDMCAVLSTPANKYSKPLDKNRLVNVACCSLFFLRVFWG
jgi:hypothetical protein